MRTAKHKDQSRLIAAAMQEIPCDLTIANVKLVNMFTGEIYAAKVDIIDGFVVRVREEGETACKSVYEYDGGGAYLLPGFIDAHMHVESTMMLPENLSRAVVPWGTTAVCTDPHEIANVLGMDGVRFMLENAKKSALRQYVLAPSCVPSAPGLEESGADFSASDIAEILDWPDVIGVAELMDFVGVYSKSERMKNIIDEGMKRGLFLQGHAPLLGGKELAAYRIAGPMSDHESYSGKEAAEKLRMGFHVNIRAGSLVDNLSDVVGILRNHRWRDFVSVCTDDIHAGDLLNGGHINRVVAKAIEAGIEPVEAYKLATLNAAREYGFGDLGAVAPGYIADLQLVDALDGRKPRAVFVEGRLAAENGKYVGESDDYTQTHMFVNTVNVPQMSSIWDFCLKAPKDCGDYVEINVVEAINEERVLNRLTQMKLPVTDGFVSLGDRRDLQFLCLCNRHGGQGKTIAVFKDFGLEAGAIATTVSHDSHNLTVVYKNPEDAYIAADALRKAGGGIAVARDGHILEILPLPVAGIMSELPCEHLADGVARAQKVVDAVCYMPTILLQTSVVSLPCLPGTVVTDKGIVDGIGRKFVPVFI
jgi:adenine deaminase